MLRIDKHHIHSKTKLVRKQPVITKRICLTDGSIVLHTGFKLNGAYVTTQTNLSERNLRPIRNVPGH